MHTISIIIPTYNEAENIQALILYLKKFANEAVTEIIISDASIDNTAEIASELGCKIIFPERKGRAVQMNSGAAAARGDILYFLHADTFPPKEFVAEILQAVKQGSESGCFRLRFDHDHWFLKINAWFTRFDYNAIRFGDQSLFVKSVIFEKCGGFREELIVMEDQEIIPRIKKYGRFKVLDKYMVTSARKYLHNGIYKVQVTFFVIWLLYKIGFSQKLLVSIYKKLLSKS